MGILNYLVFGSSQGHFCFINLLFEICLSSLIVSTYVLVTMFRSKVNLRVGTSTPVLFEVFFVYLTFPFSPALLFQCPIKASTSPHFSNKISASASVVDLNAPPGRRGNYFTFISFPELDPLSLISLSFSNFAAVLKSNFLFSISLCLMI